MSINTAGAIAGYYYDTHATSHGFLRSPSGAFTSFDVPGAGIDGEGTFATGINEEGDIAGDFSVGYGVHHGFVSFSRSASGTFTTFAAPGAGTYPAAISASGAAAGFYIDAAGLSYGFLRAASGTFTTFSSPANIPGTIFCICLRA